VAGVGDDEVAVGVPDVGRQLRAAPGRVDAYDGGPAQRRGADPKDVVRHVLQEHSEVRRAPGAALRPPRQLRERRPGTGGLNHLGPGVGLVLEQQPDVIVVGTVEEQLREGRHRG
jgi:hypothetical protein